MKKSIFVLALCLFLTITGCATTGLLDSVDTLISLPFEITGTVLKEVDILLFGTEYKDVVDTPCPPIKPEQSKPEKKKSFYRDENGNIRY